MNCIRTLLLIAGLWLGLAVVGWSQTQTPIPSKTQSQAQNQKAPPDKASAKQASSAIPRVLPPPGVEVPAEKEQALRTTLGELTQRIAQLRKSKLGPQVEPRLPDVEIFTNAIRYALDNHEIFDLKELPKATELLQLAKVRLDALEQGAAPWNQDHLRVVRGYRSAIDDSVQPYGLVIPEKLDLSRPNRLIVFLHGRGNTLSELNFLYGVLRGRQRVAPENYLVLHPYGRYCNAFKFAGELDVLEALADVQKNYNIDADRVLLWGFSMGGAGAWHLGAHYPDLWAGVAPGAGFADTARYQNLKPEQFPPVYEQKLWGVYDVPPYVRNLFNVPVVAYSGEIDKQKQAADLMAEALLAEGKTLTHLIGPKTAHDYHPETLVELIRQMDVHATAGRDRLPEEIHFQTRTLRYSKCFWVQLLGLEKHWQDSRLDAVVKSPSEIQVGTKNVSGFQIVWPKPNPPLPLKVVVDGQTVTVTTGTGPRPVVTLEKADGQWSSNFLFARGSNLRKTPGLQGPIDDIFWEPFLVVLPSGKSQHPAVQKWVDSELAHFEDRWKRLFRGTLRVKQDTDVTYDDMLNYHVLAWGDRDSNTVLKRAADYWPISWKHEEIRVGEKSFAADHHALMLVTPNPLLQRATKYLVVNSGPTFRESHDKTNAQQNPKLPDWAVIDLSVPPNDLTPGRVADAGFFDEFWRLPGK